MIFLNAQRPSLMKDAYIYGADSVMFDLEDAVSESQKDAARFSLYNCLKTIDYGSVERIVRINGLDTPYWAEDVRAVVAGGADGIRIPKCEFALDVKKIEEAIDAAEIEFGREQGSTSIMAAIEGPRGVLNALEICEASKRLFGIALSGGDYRSAMQTKYYPSGVELQAARGNLLIAARAAGVQCFDTVFTDLSDMDGFRAEVIMNKEMGFDGKSIINPRQIPIVHEIYTPTEKEIMKAERIVRSLRENNAKGLGVFVVDGKMLDVAFLRGAERILTLAQASGVYKGEHQV
jgi:citrate lyase subunit beta/citryl-CoA lyase